MENNFINSYWGNGSINDEIMSNWNFFIKFFINPDYYLSWIAFI